MNKIWKNELTELKTMKGWTMIPSMLYENFKKLGLTTELVVFIVAIISHDEGYTFYDCNMTDHGCSRTLKRYRLQLKKMGYLKYSSYTKVTAEGIRSSGFQYDLSGLLEAIKNEHKKVSSEGQDYHGEDKKWPTSNPKCSTTKESILNNLTKESTTKKSINSAAAFTAGGSVDPCDLSENMGAQGRMGAEQSTAAKGAALSTSSSSQSPCLYDPYKLKKLIPKKWCYYYPSKSFRPGDYKALDSCKLTPKELHFLNETIPYIDCWDDNELWLKGSGHFSYFLSLFEVWKQSFWGKQVLKMLELDLDEEDYFEEEYEEEEDLEEYSETLIRQCKGV